MAESAIVIATTIIKYIKGREDDVMRNQKILAMLKSKGVIDYNQTGKSFEWRVKYRRQPLQQIADGGNYNYGQQDKWKPAGLPYRGYAAGDSITKKQKLMNRGMEALIDRLSDIAKDMMDDVESNFQYEFYGDGNAAGKEDAIHGIESFMGVSGATTAVSGSVAMNPSDTYADLNTDLGSYGGNWTGNWPVGKGDPEYDFYSPLILDYTSTLATASGGWTSATATWAARAPEVVRYAIIHAGKNTSLKGPMDMILMDREMYRLFLDNQTTKERIVVSAGAKKGGLVSLGFGDTFNYDGVDITQEYGIPSNTAYGWNMSKVELKSLQGTLFDATGPLTDNMTLSDLFAVDFYGNLKFDSPRNFVKIAAYGSAGT